MSAHAGEHVPPTQGEPVLPRTPPGAVLMHLGSMASAPGFAQFLAEAQSIGFGLAQPGDHDLTAERWAEVSDLRVRALIASYKRSRESNR